MHQPMKPPFCYYGGKQRMAHNIIPYLPKHTVYVEPFCGSATLLFKKPWPEVTDAGHYIEYINDSNELVYNFFEVLKTDGARLNERLKLCLASEKLYFEAKHPELIEDDFERAVAFFINIRQSFSSNLNAGWGYGAFKRNLVNSFIKSTDIEKYIERIRRVGLFNRDALKVIKALDRPQTFFYCDPPYPGTNQGHYAGYTQADFEALVELAETCEGSFIISCYAQDDVFSDCWSSAKFASRSSSARNKSSDSNRTERIYIKQSGKPRHDIQKLYDSGNFDCFANRGLFEKQIAG